MNLYLLRHAKAEDRRPFLADKNRPLTKAGEKKLQAVIGGMMQLRLNFHVILSSPFVRARRTAEIVAEHFEPKQLEFTPHLAVDGDQRLLVRELAENYAVFDDVLLVGHEPDLSQLASVLLSGEDDLRLIMKKAGLCKLTVGEPRYGRCATLDWLLTPGQLEKLGKK